MVTDLLTSQPTTSRARVACPNEDRDAAWRVRIAQATAAFVLHQQRIHRPRLHGRSTTVVDQQAAVLAFDTEILETHGLSLSAIFSDGDRQLPPAYPSEVEETLEELITERE